MILCNDTIENYYKVNFSILLENFLTLTELETMLPYEREIYIYQYMGHLKKKREREEQNAAKHKAARR